VIGALPAIVAVPFRDYELTLLAPLGTLGLLAIGSSAARAEGNGSVARAGIVVPVSQARPALRGLYESWPKRSTMRALLVAVIILAPAFLVARHLEAEHERWDRGERKSPTVVLAVAPDRLAPAPT
jgi:hypothetical protein